jgi:hypothetical protein
MPPGPRQEDAVDPASLDQMAVGAHLVSARAGGGDQQVELGGLQPRADGGKEAQKKWVVELAGRGRQHHPDRLAAPAPQAPRRVIRPVVDPASLGHHSRARRRRHVVEPAERTRDGSDGKAKAASDIGQRHGVRVRNVLDERLARSKRFGRQCSAICRRAVDQPSPRRPTRRPLVYPPLAELNP